MAKKKSQPNGMADLWEMEEEDSSPLHLLIWSPVLEAAIRPPQYKTLPRDTSVFNRRIGGHVPPPSHSWTPPVGRRYAARSQSWTSLKQ